jgi:hypothetical protein
MAGAAPGQPVERVAAAAAVADVLDHERGVRRHGVRQQQPALDGVPGIAGECHVEYVRVPDAGVFYPGEQRLRAVRGGGRGRQFGRPELGEVGGFLDGRLVTAELVQGQVAQHGTPSGLVGWPPRDAAGQPMISRQPAA